MIELPEEEMLHMFLFTKKILLALFILSYVAFGQGSYLTKVKLSDSSDEKLRQILENNLTSFLTELNNAYFQNSYPQVDAKILTPKGREVLFSLWETSPFRCIETEIVEKVVEMMSKREKTYQVRNIPIFLQNVFETGDDTSENHYQEICLIIDSDGMIENIFYSLESNIYNKLMNDGIDPEDRSRREFILEFIENFRTAYNRKDMDFLSSVFLNTTFSTENTSFNNDSSGFGNNLISEYQKYTQEVYLQNLSYKILRYNKFLNVVFSEIRINRDEVYPEIYGINFKQRLITNNYKDVGYIFFIIDFEDEQNPIFLVRAWQPEDAAMSKEGIFNLNSFDIER